MLKRVLPFNGLIQLEFRLVKIDYTFKYYAVHRNTLSGHFSSFVEFL